MENNIDSEKENEDDVDDIDIGYGYGITDGIDENYTMIKVALYKMFKKGKINNLDFMLDEIHNTIEGMDNADFKIWVKNFKKYIKNKRKEESHLEDKKRIGENENGKT